MSNKMIKCCICGKKIPVEMGNNPAPIRTASFIGDTENRCCNECNDVFVTPARITLLHSTREQYESISKQLNNLSYDELLNIFSK